MARVGVDGTKQHPSPPPRCEQCTYAFLLPSPGCVVPILRQSSFLLQFFFRQAAQPLRTRYIPYAPRTIGCCSVGSENGSQSTPSDDAATTATASATAFTNAIAAASTAAYAVTACNDTLNGTTTNATNITATNTTAGSACTSLCSQS